MLIIIDRRCPHDVRSPGYVHGHLLLETYGGQLQRLKDKTDAARGTDVHLHVIHTFVTRYDRQFPGTEGIADDLRTGHIRHGLYRGAMLFRQSIGRAVLPYPDELYLIPGDRAHRYGRADALASALAPRTIYLKHSVHLPLPM